MKSEFEKLPLLESLNNYHQIRSALPEACRNCLLADDVAISLGILAARMQLDVPTIKQQYGAEMSLCQGQIIKKNLIPFRAKKVICTNPVPLHDSLIPNILTKVNNPNSIPN